MPVYYDQCLINLTWIMNLAILCVKKGFVCMEIVLGKSDLKIFWYEINLENMDHQHDHLDEMEKGN